MSSSELSPSAKETTFLQSYLFVLVLGLMLPAVAALLYKMTLGAGAAGASTFTGFEAYLHQRGCVVAHAVNGPPTSYRCDAPVAGAYLSRTQLEDDFQRSKSAKP